MRCPSGIFYAIALCFIPSLAHGQAFSVSAEALPSHVLVPLSATHRLHIGLNTPQIPVVVKFQQPVSVRRATSPPDNSLLIENVRQYSAFELRILVHPLSNPDVEVKAEINVGQSFFRKVSSDFQGVRFNRISGGVLPPKGGIYPVHLIFFDARSGGGSLEDQVMLMLTPGKPYQRTISGGAVCYAVTLINISP